MNPKIIFLAAATLLVFCLMIFFSIKTKPQETSQLTVPSTTPSNTPTTAPASQPSSTASQELNEWIPFVVPILNGKKIISPPDKSYELAVPSSWKVDDSQYSNSRHLSYVALNLTEDSKDGQLVLTLGELDNPMIEFDPNTHFDGISHVFLATSTTTIAGHPVIKREYRDSKGNLEVPIEFVFQDTPYKNLRFGIAIWGNPKNSPLLEQTLKTIKINW